MTILVIGNSVVDRSYRVKRLPRPGETMIAEESQVDFGGKGFNQAVSAARAGGRVAFATAVGDDVHGRNILAALRGEGIDVGLATIRPGPTDEAAIFVMPDGENSIVCSIHSARHAGVDVGLKSVEALQPGDWLVMQGNIDRAVSEQTLVAARASAARTVVNPSPILFDYADLWAFIDIAIVNAVELADLAGLEGLTRPQDIDAAAQRLLALGCGMVVVTLGASGARLYEAGDKDGRIIEAQPAAAIDSTGAGDTCCGVFVAALAQGMEPEHALALGVRSAALSVSRLGSMAALPTTKELAQISRELAAAGSP